MIMANRRGVIDALGYESICCFDGSFCAGILAKTMPGQNKSLKMSLHICWWAEVI